MARNKVEYRIDEEQGRVFVIEAGDRGNWMSFDSMECCTSAWIVAGKYGWRHIPRRRRIAYAVARDELLDRGLIRERVTRKFDEYDLSYRELGALREIRQATGGVTSTRLSQLLNQNRICYWCPLGSKSSVARVRRVLKSLQEMGMVKNLMAWGRPLYVASEAVAEKHLTE